MKILQLYHKVPFPPRDGGSCSLVSSSKSLISQGVDLKILAMDTLRAPCDRSRIPEEFALRTRFECVGTDNRIRPWQAAGALLTRNSYLSSRFISEGFRTRLRELLREEKFDIVQVEHLYLCHYTEDIRQLSNARIVLRAQNVEHRIWERYCKGPGAALPARYLRREAGKLKRFEQEAVRRVDGILALTEEDAEWFSEAGGTARIAVIPYGIEPECAGERPSRPVNGRKPSFYHLGSMDWRPNIQGMKWFLKEILPEAVALDPDVHVSMAGRNMPGWFLSRTSRNLSVTGEVEDGEGFGKERDVMIVPLLSGSGIRVKILMAMAMGKAVLSTPLGASGIRAVHDESIIIAANKNDFAKQMARLAGSPDLVMQIGRRAREVVRTHYDVRQLGRQMIGFYNTLT